LRSVNAPGRQRHALGFDDRQEVFEVAQVHMIALVNDIH
jgi:hypothetical protein